MSIKQEINSLMKEFLDTSHDMLDAVIMLGEGRTPTQNPEQLMSKIIEIDKKFQISVKKCTSESVNECWLVRSVFFFHS
jgi:GTP-binding protein EngB required for normal cell division